MKPNVATAVAPAPRTVILEVAGAATDAAKLNYSSQRSGHWDAVAEKARARKSFRGAYHRRLAEIYGFYCPPGKRVLEVGCGQGDLLAALKPEYGVGIDFSKKM